MRQFVTILLFYKLKNCKSVDNAMQARSKPVWILRIIYENIAFNCKISLSGMPPMGLTDGTLNVEKLISLIIYDKL